MIAQPGPNNAISASWKNRKILVYFTYYNLQSQINLRSSCHGQRGETGTKNLLQRAIDCTRNIYRFADQEEE